MTIEAMRWHESVTLRYAADDYRRSSLIKLIKRHVQGRQVLDLRCLTGHLSAELIVEGHDVVAFDGYEPAVAMTNDLVRRHGQAAPVAHLWDLTGLPGRVGNARFDTVICADVLNHVIDDDAAMADIAQSTALSDRLIVVPAFPLLLGIRDQSLGHLRRYSKKGITELLAKHGFVVDHLRYWNFAALPGYFAVEKVMRRRLSDGLRYGRQFKAWPNRLLAWWYSTVENNMPFPFGLSHFVIAHKKAAQ